MKRQVFSVAGISAWLRFTGSGTPHRESHRTDRATPFLGECRWIGTVACAAACHPASAPAEPAPRSIVIEPVTRPSASPPAGVREESEKPVGPPSARITEFDCSSDVDTGGQKLRDFKGGGPNGAVWNWYSNPLTCRVTITTGCASEMDVELFVGKSPPHARKLSAGAAEQKHIDFPLLPEQWEPELGGGFGAYETLLFVVRVDGDCKAEEGVPAESFHWSDSFIGGFSGGE